MNKEVECRRIAEQLGWREVTTLEGLRELGIPDHTQGESVWAVPAYYKIVPGQSRWVRELDFDPWEDANDDLLVLDMMRNMTPLIWGDYKDCLYHETKGHGTHNVWEYKRGKFANAAIMVANMLGWR